MIQIKELTGVVDVPIVPMPVRTMNSFVGKEI